MWFEKLNSKYIFTEFVPILHECLVKMQSHEKISSISSVTVTGLPRSGKNIWKMKFFPGQGKVREFSGWPGKFRKDLDSQGKVREFENKWLWQAVLRKFIYAVQEEKGCSFSEIV